MTRKIGNALSNTYVYRNLHKSCWSLSRGGKKVFLHAPAVMMKNCEFRVREGGRQKVLATKRKTVHAFVIGEPIHVSLVNAEAMVAAAGVLTPGGVTRVTYNPYKAGAFVLADHPAAAVTNAERVLLASDGKVYVSGIVRIVAL